MNYRTRVSCSHCGELNDAGTTFCKACGHCADRPRMACICHQCTGPIVSELTRHVLLRGKAGEKPE
jgi:hypothetical protein